MRYPVSRRLLASLVVAFMAGIGTSAAGADTPPPPGANNWNCRPGSLLKPQPRPVILVHGTFENMFDNWGFLSSTLSTLGYCVYALNYGENPYSAGVIYGLDRIENSAAQLAAFVDRVLASTRASKVDIVGHSQGGMMPRYYLKYLGGASKVNHLIGLAPSNHGTDLGGLLTLAGYFPAFRPYADQIRAGGETVAATICPACVQQLKDSDFLTTLNAGGETLPDVKYTVIATRYDEVVTPYTSAFLAGGSNVRNITLQDECPFDPVEHIFLPHDPVAINLVVNALNPATGFVSPSMYCSGRF
jgi:triacylglycerol esterase/lipase EstA (alpha/beta hydrolase family)